MIKKIIKGAMIVGLPWLFMINPAWSVDYGLIRQETIYIEPSHLKPNKPAMVIWYIAGHDPYNGELLDLVFIHEVIGLQWPREKIENNGGHTHDYNGHPLIDPPDGKLEYYYGTVIERGDLWIVGRTQKNVAVIKHRMPQVAGKIRVETDVIPPPEYECFFGCFNEFTLNVRVKELQQLSDPLPDEHYEKLRGGVDTHPEGYYGTGDTIRQLKEIAEEYYDRSDRVLSVNDISLPKGGLFDYRATWTPPHWAHRTGTDADINRKGIDCYEDQKLRKAVEEVAGGQVRPYLQCEDLTGKPVPPEDPSGKYKHIDFD